MLVKVSASFMFHWIIYMWSIITM